jgi:uncharacterized protein (DUF1800 family)
MTPTLAAIRFGYGLPPSPVMQDVANMLAALGGPDQAAAMWPANGLSQVLPTYRAAALARKQARQGDDARKAYRAAVRAVQDQAQQGMQTTVARALGAPDAFRERLVWFWADHFTAEAKFRIDAGLPGAMIEDAIRPHVADRFADMLRGVTLHPAMLLYLDQVKSIGPNSRAGSRKGKGLNENLARELIELHTLGVAGSYSQDDVRQAAELLTGATTNPDVGFVFNPDWAEPGAEVVLGITYAGEGVGPIDALLDDLAMHPATAAHLARKLAVHFVSDTPDHGMVQAMTQAYVASGGVLMDVYAAMLHHPAAWGDVAEKARQPYDFIVAALGALAVSPDRIIAMAPNDFRKRVLLPMATMGQDWGKPGGPDGWEEGAADWINAEGLAARITWAMETPVGLGPLPDPRDLVVRALGGRATARLIWAASAAESPIEGVGLILASAEFNRR